MLWKIALIATVLYYTVLILLEKKDRRVHNLKKATANAIGKTGILAEVEEEKKIGEGTTPNLFGSTTVYEEPIETFVTIDPEAENPNREEETKEESPENRTQEIQPEAVEILPEPINQNLEIEPVEMPPKTQAQKTEVSEAKEASKISTGQLPENQIEQKAEPKEAVPKMNDEEKRNFLFVGTSLDTNVVPQKDDVIFEEDKELEESMEALVSEGMPDKKP